MDERKPCVVCSYPTEYIYGMKGTCCGGCFDKLQNDTRPKCLKCGTFKVVDLFKGEYCPRCNDWC